MGRLKIGDIVEIGTPQGMAYAVLTHKHAQYGALIRVLGKIHEDRPSDASEILVHDVQFSCFFPLGAAVARKIVSVVGTVQLPAELATFPVFRTGVVDPATGKVRVWWFWDGTTEWAVGELTTEQRQVPIRGVWNDALLVERLLAGWTAESDPT